MCIAQKVHLLLKNFGFNTAVQHEILCNHTYNDYLKTTTLKFKALFIIEIVRDNAKFLHGWDFPINGIYPPWDEIFLTLVILERLPQNT